MRYTPAVLTLVVGLGVMVGIDLTREIFGWTNNQIIGMQVVVGFSIAHAVPFMLPESMFENLRKRFGIRNGAP